MRINTRKRPIEEKLMPSWLGLPVLFLLVSPSIVYTQTDNISNISKTGFEKLFTFAEKIVVTGNEQAPFYSVWQPFVSDNRIFVTDYVGDQVLIFTKSGNLVKKLGGRGQGPKEFKMPYGLLMDSKGYLYINDRGNQRVQIFDANLNFVSIITTPGQNERILLREKENQVNIISFGVAGCKQGHCLIQEYDFTGSHIKNFGDFEGKFIVYSWAANIDDKGNIYFVNQLEQELRVFQATGNEVKRIRLKSPSMRSLKIDRSHEPTTREELLARTRILDEEEHTSIHEIFIRGSFIFVFQRLVGPKKQKMFLDIWNEDASLIHHGIEVPGWLHCVTDKFYFVRYDERSDYGRMEINGYQFIPKN